MTLALSLVGGWRQLCEAGCNPGVKRRNLVVTLWNMEPSEAVVAAESSLRTAIRLTLPDWIHANGAPDRESLERKQEEDRKRRDGSVVEADLLSYTEVHHLENLIMKNWERFKPVFGDQARTKVFIGALIDYRIPVAHSRDLTSYERDLLSGISGQLRNQVALYRTTNEPSSAHYPVIELVSDGLGRVLSESWSFLDGGPRLEVGQKLEFHCRAWDVHSRPLVWEFAAAPQFVCTKPSLFLIQGREVRFSVPIEAQWVGEHIEIQITVKTEGPHYRYPEGQDGRPFGFDDARYGGYAVNPPQLTAQRQPPNP